MSGLKLPIACLLLAGLSTGCGKAYIAPQPPAEPAPVAVNVPFDRALDLVAAELGRSNTPMATVDRGTGLVVAQAIVVKRPQSTEWSDCGKIKGYATERDRGFATRGSFEVMVRPAGQGSTIHVTARWSKPDMDADRATCVSTGVFERALEARIRAAADLH